MDLIKKANEINDRLCIASIAMKDRRTPLIAKAFSLIAIAYALSPIDLIPDFIPLLGYLDDVIILPVLIALSLRFIPEEAKKEAEKKKDEARMEKRWYYAMPVIAVYLLIAIAIIRKAVQVFS